MPGFAVTLCLAVASGALAFFAWGRSTSVALAAGAVCVGVSLVALMMALFIGVVWAFKLLPVALVGVGVWLVWRMLHRRRGSCLPERPAF